jgi:hypothetical protein
MKPYVKLIVIHFFLLLGMFFLLRLLSVWFLGRPMDAPVIVTGMVWIILFSLIYWGILIRDFKPRLDYIRKADISPPDFKVVVTRNMDVPHKDFSIGKLQEILSLRYVVTFASEEHHVLKLRDRFSLSSWGACTFIQVREEEGTLLLASYPMLNRTLKQGNAGRRQNEAVAEMITGMVPANE